jgi:hypothetical protein
VVPSIGIGSAGHRVAASLPGLGHSAAYFALCCRTWVEASFVLEAPVELPEGLAKVIDDAPHDRLDFAGKLAAAQRDRQEWQQQL